MLPDRLNSGDVIKTRSTTAIIHRTSEKDEFGEPVYRLRFKTGVISNGKYSRDELQELGAELVEEVIKHD